MLDEIIYDIVDDSNEEESHESDGRNLDYGHEKSDSHEGSTAKKALLTMAKDLYHLYVTLNDSDDLPEWCHYKLATSRKCFGSRCAFTQFGFLNPIPAAK